MRMRKTLVVLATALASLAFVGSAEARDPVSGDQCVSAANGSNGDSELQAILNAGYTYVEMGTSAWRPNGGDPYRVRIGYWASNQAGGAWSGYIYCLRTTSNALWDDFSPPSGW
jgi:hypothetical protein